MFKRENAIRIAKGNMFLVMVFTLINIALMFLKVYVTFPFSLFSPYIMAAWAAMAYSEHFIPDMIFYLCMFTLSFGAFLAAYLLAQSKSKLLIIGLVIYLLDTAYMFYYFLGADLSIWIMYAGFHLWVILSLAYGIAMSFQNAAPAAPIDAEVKETPDDHERL